MTLSIFAGLMVINSVFALPSPEDRKALCDKHPDKYVWVKKTQACIPINPCKSNDTDIKKAYCDDTTFANTSLTNVIAASVIELPDLYRSCLTGEKLSGGTHIRYPWASKPDYLAKHDVTEGTYKVYKFANADLDGQSSAIEYLNAVCNAIGGANTGRTYYNDAGFASIDCKSTCQGVYEMLKQVMDFELDFDIDYGNNQVTMSFKSERACYAYKDCMNK